MERATVRGPRDQRWRVGLPTTRAERIRGLLGSDPPAIDEGLLLLRTRSVHTFGMGSTIGVALLDRGLSVRRVLRVRPRRLVLPRRGVRHVLECHADADLRPGDRLTIDRDLSRAGRGARER